LLDQLRDYTVVSPTLDSPVYNCSSKTPAAIHGVLVWHAFDQVVGLKPIVRQGHDKNVFKRLMSDLRQYNLSVDQAKWLQRFQWDNLRVSHGKELLTHWNSCKLGNLKQVATGHRLQKNTITGIPPHDLEKFAEPTIPQRHKNSIHPRLVAPIKDLSSMT
jgi:hypothetical protein